MCAAPKPVKSDSLPIDAVLPALLSALAAHGLAVLQAPPGAGKTTRVPLAMLAAGSVVGKIIMLEPRRLAVRAAAERMAHSLGEQPGQTVGYRMRGESLCSAATKIEVVTEGILTRMIQSDPMLDGVGALIFDEFHERSLNADLGLALAHELRVVLRPDLQLIVMSATLDAAPVAEMLGAPVLTAEGRAFPVETRWLARPLPAGGRLEPAVAAEVQHALEHTQGGILVFLPGAAEIRRVETLLRGHVPPGCTIRPLYGAMDSAAQRAAIAPDLTGRKIVLATAIAETSFTIEDVRVVIDAGRARRARFDPASGMTRLITERVTRAEAEQRRGRAGRVAPGVCYRMWSRGEEGGLAAFAPAEIESADLTSLALELALWGAGRGAGLAFLTPPNPGAMAEACALLMALVALGVDGTITAHGRALAQLPLHPRLGHMVLRAGPDGAGLAALLADRDVLRAPLVDLSLRLSALADARVFAQNHPWEIHRVTLERVRAEAKRLARLAPKRRSDMVGFGAAEQAALP